MKPVHVALAIAIALIWGINFVVAKAAVGYFPSFFLLAVRLTLAAVILLPFIKKPSISIKKLAVISVTLTVVHFGLMFAALEHGLDSAVAVVLDQLRVPFAVTLGYFLFGEELGKRGVFGIVVAMLGTFVIVGTPNITENYAAFWMLVGCSLAWAVYNIQVKNLSDFAPLSFIGWMAILGAPQLYLISFLIEDNQLELLVNMPPMAVFSLLYITIGATIIAHGCWYYLLKKYPVNHVVPYSLLVPVFGMFSGVLMLDEELTWQVMVGGSLTIVGVAIVVFKRPKAAIVGEAT